MNRLLLNLRQVPQDEADEVRALLQAHGIAYYETPPGRWGISLPGLWVREADYPQARAHFDAYQRERSARVRAEQEALRARGQAPGFWHNLRQHPLRVLLALAGIVLLLLLLLWPFYRL